MTGIRTASLLTVVAGLCFVAGRGGVYPSEVLASLAPDGVMMRRLQIVMGRPSTAPAAEVEEEPVPPSAPPKVIYQESGEREYESPDPEPAPEPIPLAPAPAPEAPTKTAGVSVPTLAQAAPVESEPAGEQAAIDEFRGTFTAIERANLRSVPERDGRRMVVVREGEELEVTGRTLDGAWYRVQRGDQPAYVASDLVRPLRIDTPLGMLDFTTLDQSIDELDDLLRGARFDQVVASAQRLRVRLWTARRFVNVNAPAVRIESAAGVALIALGRTTDAEECFGRALEAEPDLELDASRFSPKVLRTFRQVRTSISPS